MTPGDVLYLPKSVVHFATTDPGVVASHLTLSLSREGRTWQEVVNGMCQMTRHRLCPYLREVLNLHVAEDEGVPWLDLVGAVAPCEELQQRILGFQPSSLRSAIGSTTVIPPSYVSSSDIHQLLTRLGKCGSDLGIQDGELVQVARVLQQREEVRAVMFSHALVFGRQL